MPIPQPTLVSPAEGTSQVQANKEKDADTRLNVRLSPEVRKALDWIAETRGVSAVEAVRLAIGTEKFFQELVSKGAKILVELPNERHVKEVIFTR